MRGPLAPAFADPRCDPRQTCEYTGASVNRKHNFYRDLVYFAAAADAAGFSRIHSLQRSRLRPYMAVMPPSIVMFLPVM